MRGSVLILTLFIMIALSMLLITAFSIAESHLIITRNNNLHQEVYYLAESGMGYAQDKLHNIVMQIHQECLSEFQWNPLKQPTYTLQKSANEYMENKLGQKIDDILHEMELYNNFPIPEIAGLQPDSKINIQIKFTDIYINPSRLLISSRANIGNIRRRIDAEIHINKVSKIYDSYLFDKTILTGKDILVLNGGELTCLGSLHIQGGIHVLDNSKLNIHELVSVAEEIKVSNSSQALFNGEVICYGLHLHGEAPSTVKCLNDIYSYSVLSVKNSGNTIQVKGKLYISPEDESISAGVSTVNGGRIYLNDEIFINGTLQYEAESQCLFGIAYIPVENGIYQSSESIGGGNIKFYFPDYTPEYAKGFFTPDFERLSQQEQCNLIFEYISTPPSSEQDISQYLQHLGEMDLGSNHLNNENSLSGYTSGLIFANNKTLEPLSMPEPEVFFENILKEMKFQTGWDYNSQINCNISVPLVNTVLEGNILSVIDPEQAIVCIVPENKDLSIPSGEYRGIIMTNGSIHIPSDSNVVFNGLLIAGENLMVEGKLTQSKDKDIILNLLDTQDGTLSKFFRIEQEKPLFEIISCSESLYSEQW